MKILAWGLAGLLATGVTQQIRADVGTGAVLGGLAGGIIGHQSRETAAGIAVGAVAGGLIGATLDRGHRTSTTVVTSYRDGYDPRYAPPRPVRHVRYVEPCREVVVHVPRPRPRAVVVVVRSEPTPPPCVIVAEPPSCLADNFGYTSADYLALMKPSELGLLRQRAHGRPCDDLAVHLTEREKNNLRARAARQVEIGA